MADANSSPAASGNAQQPPQQQRQPQNGSFIQQILQYVMMYLLITNIFTFFKPKSSTSSNSDLTNINEDFHKIPRIEKPTEFQTALMGVNPNANLPVFPTRDSEGRKLGNHKCLFTKGILLDFYLFITDDKYFNYVEDIDKLVWNIKDIPFNSSFTQNPIKDINITVSTHMLGNGSVTAHVFFAKSSSVIDANDDSYQPDDVAYQKFDLIRYRKKKIPKKTYKLLETFGKNEIEKSSDSEPILALPSGTDDGSSNIDNIEKNAASNELTVEADKTVTQIDEVEDGQIVPYWVPTLDIVIVQDMPDAFGRNAIPSAILQHLSFNEIGNYYPVIYHNDFFLTTKHLIEINQTVESVPLHLSMGFMSFLRWHMQSQMEQSWKRQEQLGTGSERDTDMIREVLFDTNPWLLGITFAVSLLHMLFDFLAFKNDIQFWRKKKSMAGTSVQSLGVNCFFQTIIFLYLMDNDTSWMILLSSGIGLLIEYWKLTKAFNVTFHRRNTLQITSDGAATQESGMKLKVVDKLFGIPLPFQMKWKLSDSYTTSKTREYDAIATTHLLYVVIPIVFGYSIYSLIHISHKSFYSWALGSLVGFVYAFGFVLMTPQLFINYKLKSVAHMPWKAMVYKALNTFIDDLFAFVIKMPIMHRLACFRDDIIFFIYLYQRWVYAVDMSRVNEFGQGGDENPENEAVVDLISPNDATPPSTDSSGEQPTQ